MSVTNYQMRMWHQMRQMALQRKQKALREQQIAKAREAAGKTPKQLELV